jgi:class 3 adenylate cyclase
MFVDLVGSTVMSARRDPEMAAVVRLDRNTVAGEIARFDELLSNVGDGRD